MGSVSVTTEHRATMLLNIILISLPLIYCSPSRKNAVGNLSRFQVAVQHCCSSKTSKTPQRCFELNEFSGVNFVSSPCRYLRTLEKTLSAVEPSVQNCCSNRNSNTPYRCFETNGVEGVNFVERP